MGLVTGQIRLVFLTLFKNDLEYKIQLITQTKLQLINNINELMSIGSDLDSDSPEVRLLDQRRKKLLLISKQLNAALERYKTQLSATETEIQSAQKIVDNNIKLIYSYGRGASG